MSGYRALVWNASGSLAGRFASIVLAAVLSAVLFRAIGAQAYGVWSLLVTIASYSMLLDFGLSVAIERRVAVFSARQDSSGISGTVRSGLTVAALTLAVVQAVAAVLVPVLSTQGILAGELARGLVVLPLCAALTMSGLIAGAGLAGLQRMWNQYLWRTAGLVVGTLAVCAAIWLGVRRVDALLVSYCTGGLLTLGGSWRDLRRLVPGLRFMPCWDREAVREFLHFGSVLQVATMVPVVAEYAFRIALGGRFGIEYAGIYDLAARAAMAPRSLAGALFTVMVPFSVRTAASAGPLGTARLVRLASRHAAFFILPVTALAIFSADSLMTLWLGRSPAVVAVTSGFEVLLVTHAIGALSVPAAMVARAASRPIPEATVAVVSFSIGLLGAMAIPSFLAAFALFWGVPAGGGFLLWWWVNRRLDLRFSSGRDFAVASALAVFSYVVAAVIAEGLTRELPQLGPLARVLTATTGASLALVAVAIWFGIVQPAEWKAMRGLIGRSLP